MVMRVRWEQAVPGLAIGVAFVLGAVFENVFVPEPAEPTPPAVEATPDECRQALVFSDEAIGQAVRILDAGLDLLEVAEGGAKDAPALDVVTFSTRLGETVGWFDENVGAYRSARRACLTREE